ncbi:DUF3137 domain-containing protein [Pseudosulfitobacter koreensis]|uniref:DUF3137 domain-containing protein n=1 Tax=Pseudosulfitobacter koreensis TaxID=2968472 RepID=A0ABT1YZ08_9RHOB|nr:DUF3137 domain-containing protein [Pseudosulfitobacter koreense]MCR8826086.1 DUF3137 domain-containing protein [Pseudosulfitobacter koreense]
MAGFTFIEHGDHERGFAAVYDREIAPFLREKEEVRAAAVRRSQLWTGAVFGISVVLALLAFRVHPMLPLFPLVFGGAAALFLYLTRGEKISAEVTHFIRPVICSFFDDMTFSETEAEGGFPKRRLEALGIVPRADESTIGPSIRGVWRGIGYTVTKASFRDAYRDSASDNRTRRTHLFGGIVLKIDCLEDMPTIVFCPDLGGAMNAVMKWATPDLPPFRFEFPDARVEEVFEVYTDDPDLARKRLHQGFGERLLGFARDYQASKTFIAAAFQGRAFYLAIDLPHDFMNFDVASRPLDACNAKIHKALDDLMIPRRIIDILLG